MHDIFISYAHEDKLNVRRLVDLFEKQGWSVWWDELISLGEKYAELLDEALKESRCVIVCWSNASLQSEYVRSEAHTANARESLVQVLLEEVTVPSPFDQYSISDLTSWPDTERGQYEAQKLLRDVNKRLTTESPVMPTGAVGKTSGGEPSPGSILVLPFSNIGSDKDNEYFSDGLTDDIINTLSKVPYLRVVARASSFVLKDKNEDVGELGARMRVRYIVSGSVRKAGDRMRIVAHLTPVKDGFQIWSETFDRKVLDVFDTLDDIAQAIVSHLTEVIGNETDQEIEPSSAPLFTRHTSNIDAYKFYLKGRYHWNQRGEGIGKGMELFQEAAAADPTYALPYVGLADSFALLGYYGFMKPEDAFPRAHENATRALKFDSSLGEAHASRALVNMYYDWDWAGAEQEFTKAIELNPRYAPAHYWLSVLYTILQKPEQAMEEDKKAFKVDPGSPYVYMHHGWTLHCAKRVDEAIEFFNEALALDAKLLPVYQLLILSNAEAGNYEASIKAGETIKRVLGNNILPLPAIGYAHAKCGGTDKALEVVRELEARAKSEFFWPSHLASIYAVLGDFDKAFSWIEKAFKIRDHWLITMNVQPEFRALREHPDYAEIAVRVGI